MKRVIIRIAFENLSTEQRGELEEAIEELLEEYPSHTVEISSISRPKPPEAIE